MAYFNLEEGGKRIVELIFQPKLLNLKTLGLYKTTIRKILLEIVENTPDH